MAVIVEFSFDDLDMNEQLFEDYKSKYLDLYDKVRSDRKKEEVSILDRILETEIQLRSKKELIDRFLAEHFPAVSSESQMRATFDDYWDREKEKAMSALGEEENLDVQGLRRVVDKFCLYPEGTATG